MNCLVYFLHPIGCCDSCSRSASYPQPASPPAPDRPRRCPSWPIQCENLPQNYWCWSLQNLWSLGEERRESKPGSSIWKWPQERSQGCSKVMLGLCYKPVVNIQLVLIGLWIQDSMCHHQPKASILTVRFGLLHGVDVSNLGHHWKFIWNRRLLWSSSQWFINPVLHLYYLVVLVISAWWKVVVRKFCFSTSPRVESHHLEPEQRKLKLLIC